MKVVYPFLVLSLISVNNLLACKCEDPGSVDESYKYSDIVIWGKVLKKSLVPMSESMKPERLQAIKNKVNEQRNSLLQYQLHKVDIQIIKKFKGNIRSNIITIYTASLSAACGFGRFIEGEKFIVYASSKSNLYVFFGEESNGLEKPNTYWTTHCTRTTEENPEELEALNKIVSKKK